MSAWLGRIVEILENSTKLRELVVSRGKYFYIAVEPRMHPELGSVVTLRDDDGYRFTTSVRNIRFPQEEDR